MKIGIIGAGFIIKDFLNGISNINDVEISAILIRAGEEANVDEFRSIYPVGEIFTDSDLFFEKSLDFVYVASPNNLHYPYAKRALENKINVICEKPFTATQASAVDLLNCAKDNNVMIFDAVITSYMPNFEVIKSNIEKLGSIKMISCNYSQYSSRYDLLRSGVITNVFNPDFSGGCLQDLNVYNLQFVTKLFGFPKLGTYFPNSFSNGIDTSGVAILQYDNFIANCVASKDSNSHNYAIIQGEDGYIWTNGSNEMSKVILKLNGQKEQILVDTTIHSRLQYELAYFIDIYLKQDYQKCYELIEETIKSVELIENMRKNANIIFLEDNIKQD